MTVTLLHEGFETARTDKDGNWEIRINGTYTRLTDLIEALGSLNSALGKMQAELDPAAVWICGSCNTPGECLEHKRCFLDETGPSAEIDPPTPPERLHKESALRAAFMLLGKGEYNTPSNLCLNDAHYGKSCRRRYGDKLWDWALAEAQTHK